MVRLVPQERVQQWIDKQLVEEPVPQVLEEIAEVVRFVPQRVKRTFEQIFDVLNPHFVEEVFDVSKSVVQKLTSTRLYEQIVEVSYPQLVEGFILSMCPESQSNTESCPLPRSWRQAMRLARKRSQWGLRVDTVRDGKTLAAWGVLQLLSTRSPPLCWCLSACLPQRVCWPRSGG